MSVADANRFRDLEALVAASFRDLDTRVAAMQRIADPPAPVGDTRVEALTEVVAALQRRIAAVEKQQQETALFLTRKLGANAAAR